MNPYGETAPLVDLDRFVDWIIREDDDLLVLNKPGWLVCHPSKNGPFSSLVGVVREYTGIDKPHLISRLDRETSGLVLFALNKVVSNLERVHNFIGATSINCMLWNAKNRASFFRLYDDLSVAYCF